jgi:hypothetical protein
MMIHPPTHAKEGPRSLSVAVSLRVLLVLRPFSVCFSSLTFSPNLPRVSLPVQTFLIHTLVLVGLREHISPPRP